MSFYIGLGMQLVGFSSVGICLFSGLSEGDYGKMELVQFLGGSALFYLGQILKQRYSA
ncbi:MAG: hypothetical protein H6622_03960 [Halobacteriovoraceae bacterium]|nr:hypothetical protein [Halobacteriovoraceae bacterium]